MRTSLPWLFLSISIFFLTSARAAQKSEGSLPRIHATPSPRLQFERLSLEHGLPHTRVLCILQDSRNFIWFGTKAGLARYDGYNFKVYKHDPADSTTLSNNTIWTIVEDRSQSLWIGTNNGLNRFDRFSETFARYLPDPKDSTGLSAREIRAILEDRTGTLWIGSWDGPRSKMGGLYRLDFPDSLLLKPNEKRANFTRYRYDPNDPHSLSDNAVRCIVEDDSGNLWIGTEQHGLNRFNLRTKKIIRYRHDPKNPASLSDNHVHHGIKDRDGKLWFATFGGLDQYDPQTDGFVHYQHDSQNPNSLHQNYVEALFQDASGNLWISNGVLSRYNPRHHVFNHFRFAPSQDDRRSSYAPWAIYEDSSHNLWIGTRDNGIFKADLKPQKFSYYQHEAENPNSLGANDVVLLYEDSQGRIWIALDGAGLSLFDPQTERFEHFKHDPRDRRSLSDNDIQIIYEDSPATAGRNAIWMGTANGLNKFDRNRKNFTRYLYDSDYRHGRNGNPVCTIFGDRQNTLWIGTSAGGLNKFEYEAERFFSFNPPTGAETSSRANAIVALHEDRCENFWVATFSKLHVAETLYHFDRCTNEFTPIKAANNDDPGWGFQILEGRNGMLWGGHFGLCKLDPAQRQFIRYRILPNESGERGFDSAYNSVNWIYEDKNRKLWCGTRHGLHKFDPDESRFVAHYYEKDGLPSNYILKIIGDDSGKLWLLTYGGLAIFDENAPRGQRFTTLGADDGIANTPYTYSAFIKSRSGDIYWGGAHGIYRFYPNVEQINSSVPQVRLTEFRKFNVPAQLDTSIAEIKTIHLRHDEDFFSFAFSALEFTDPQQNQYAYKLEGLDHDWIQADKPAGAAKHEANYTHVPPGKYIFRVKGSNNDGVWNEQGASVQVIVSPPFWQTWWFRILVLAIIAGIGEAVHKLRLAKRLEVERTRQRLARDLHDEIGSSLSSIALSCELLQGKTVLDGKGKDILIRMNCTARQLSESVNELVWAFNPGNDKLDNLLLRMKDAANELLSLKGISFTLDFPHEKLPQAIAMDFRRNLFLIYKELLHNIMKHSQARRVEISLAKRNDMLRLKIADDGIGFDPASINGHGNGLNNMKMRAKELGGRLKLKSQPQGGTEAVLVVKMP